MNVWGNQDPYIGEELTMCPSAVQGLEDLLTALNGSVWPRVSKMAGLRRSIGGGGGGTSGSPERTRTETQEISLRCVWETKSSIVTIGHFRTEG